MTFHDWQQLTPAHAAREVHRRIRSRLSPGQQRAVIAQLPDEAALTAAFEQADRKSPLGGIPYFLKDLFPVAGQTMLAGSTFLPEVRPAAVQDSALVSDLRRAGAVYAGRTHMHEFAYGISGENPHYGDCERPGFPGRVTGGSSSGSAAAVAAGIVPLATGSDTGGSVRLPAAFCGLFGFRLTPRQKYIADAFPLSSSYDTAGWFTATAADMLATIAALIGLGAINGTPRGSYLELPGLDDDVARACSAAAAQFTSPADAATRSALLAAFSTTFDTYNTVVAEEAWTVHRAWAERFQSRYDPGVWQRLDRARTLTEAQRDAARHGTAAIKAGWAHYFRANDFLILPASPCPALTKAECTPANRLRILTLTAPASIGGFPVLTIPVSLPSGLTTGLQIVVPSAQSPVVSWLLGKLTTQ